MIAFKCIECKEFFAADENKVKYCPYCKSNKIVPYLKYGVLFKNKYNDTTNRFEQMLLEDNNIFLEYYKNNINKIKEIKEKEKILNIYLWIEYIDKIEKIHL